MEGEEGGGAQWRVWGRAWKKWWEEEEEAEKEEEEEVEDEEEGGRRRAGRFQGQASRQGQGGFGLYGGCGVKGVLCCRLALPVEVMP